MISIYFTCQYLETFHLAHARAGYELLDVDTWLAG